MVISRICFRISTILERAGINVRANQLLWLRDDPVSQNLMREAEAIRAPH